MAFRSKDKNVANLPGIIAFAPGTWRWPQVYGSPRYHLWMLAGMGWRVLYVEPPNQLRAVTKMWKAPDREFHVLTPGRVAPFGMRMVKNEKMGERWRTMTSRQILKRAVNTAESLRLKTNIYWFGAPWHESLMRELPYGPRRVCHIYDELALSPALNDQQRQILWNWERELLRGCDVAFCSSYPQLQRRQGIPARSVLLENAVSESFLPENIGQPAKEFAGLIEKMESLPEPRFVYGGTVDHRLEPAFFDALLDNFPVGSVILLGRIDSSADNDLRQRLQSTPNVHFFGEVPYEAYPHLYQRASVLLIAHKRTPFTDGMFPEKLNEYLTSGKPIVAVAIPEVGRVARESTFREMIRTVDTPLEFIDACTVAMSDKDPVLADARIENVRTRTWPVVARRLDEELKRELSRVQS